MGWAEQVADGAFRPTAILKEVVRTGDSFEAGIKHLFEIHLLLILEWVQAQKLTRNGQI